MDATIELYWSFRSPYSYIVLPLIIALRDTYQVTIDLRIVHPNAIRNPAYFKRMDPQNGRCPSGSRAVLAGPCA